MFDLLASRGLFIGLIAVVVVVVALCIGLAVMLFLKPLKTGETVEADAVKKELYRRETELVIKIVTQKAEGKEKEELINALRRIRSAETLVDEVIRTEKTERGISDKPERSAKRPAGKPAPARKPDAEAVKAGQETAAASAEKKEKDGDEPKPVGE